MMQRYLSSNDPLHKADFGSENLIADHPSTDILNHEIWKTNLCCSQVIQQIY